MGLPALVLMAKAPRPGAVKTRLVPPLTPEEAADLTGAFIRDISAMLQRAAEISGAGCFLAHGPSDGPADFAGLVPPGFGFIAQRGSDLGARMAGLVTDLLGAGAPVVCLVGSDLPELPAGTLVRALDYLGHPGDRAVLGPAMDGGYYLIGLKLPHPALFEDIVWSTGTVFTRTMERAAGIGLPVESLRPLEDIDDPAALRGLVARLGEDPSVAPETAGFVKALRKAGRI
jgi:rSAM/selenodomain-associated transferase 1